MFRFKDGMDLSSVQGFPILKNRILTSEEQLDGMLKVGLQVGAK
jgi:hypothetical protein